MAIISRDIATVKPQDHPWFDLSDHERHRRLWARQVCWGRLGGESGVCPECGSAVNLGVARREFLAIMKARPGDPALTMMDFEPPPPPVPPSLTYGELDPAWALWARERFGGPGLDPEEAFAGLGPLWGRCPVCEAERHLRQFYALGRAASQGRRRRASRRLDGSR